MRHAWNAVKLDDKWQLMDVTWASGGLDVRSKKYVRDFDAGWFLTPPQRFLLSHWPDDARWTLGETRPDKKEFVKAPVFYRRYTAAGLHLESPRTGTIGRKTTIRLRSSEPVTRLSAYLVDTDAYLDLPVMASGDLYSTELDLPKDARGPVIIKMGGGWISGLNRK